MLLREAAAYIKENVPVETVLSLYGYTLSRDGFLRCPFHAGDHTASLKVYGTGRSGRKHGWYCFGCHAGGSVLDFVMMQESCDFTTAVRAVDRALGLNLLTPEPWQEQENYRLLQTCFDKMEALLMEQAETEEKFLRARVDAAYKEWLVYDQIPKRSRTAEDWTRWHNTREGLEYLLDQQNRLEEYIEEVHQWRSSHRVRKPGKTPRHPRNPKSA